MVLYAKIIPPRVEASLFAFLMGVSNFTNLFIAKNWANLINALFVGCNRDNLATEAWKLYVASAICSFIPVCFIWLVPTRKTVEKVQRCLEFIELYVDKTEAESPFKQEDYEKLSPITARRLGIKNPADEADGAADPAAAIGQSEDMGSQ